MTSTLNQNAFFQFVFLQFVNAVLIILLICPFIRISLVDHCFPKPSRRSQLSCFVHTPIQDFQFTVTEDYRNHKIFT